MIDYISVLKTTHNCPLDYTYATFHVNRSVGRVLDWGLRVACWRLTAGGVESLCCVLERCLVLLQHMQTEIIF